jgi:2-dehydropantoate 2-reductase
VTGLRICVFGAGAVGGVLACRLSAGGHDVSLVLRGDHLAAVRSAGLRLVSAEGEEAFRLPTSESGMDLGEQDLVICSVKAHSLPAAARNLAACARGAPILFILNGVPWWYFHRSGGALDGTHLGLVDPQGEIWNTIGPERALGSVIYMTASTPAPGTVRHHSNARLILGEPDGSISARLNEAASALKVEGLFPETTASIRTAVFSKLLNTVSLNQVCALTRSPIDAVVGDPRARNLVQQLMHECAQVGAALGAPVDVDIDARIQSNAGVSFKPSTLQDLEAGKPLEIDALVAAVSELGRLAGIQTPQVDTIYALMRRLAEEQGLYSQS